MRDGADTLFKVSEMIERGEWGFSELELLFQASGEGPASRFHHSAFLVGLAGGNRYRGTESGRLEVRDIGLPVIAGPPGMETR